MRHTWNSYGITHTGNIRAHNEDAYLNYPQQQIWLVADGMGGHTAGDVASHMIVDELENYTHTPLLGRNTRQIIQKLQKVNQELVEMAGDEGNKIIGSTVAALITQRSHGVCLWAGDSRIYRFRDDKLKQITRDHSELNELLDLGMSLKEALRSPFAQAISRAVGADRTLAVEAQIIETMENDIYLLCSDGLDKEVSDEEIADVLTSHTPDDSVQVLLKMALERKGQDNITVMIVY